MANYSESEWEYVAWLDALGKVLARDYEYNIVELLTENPKLASAFNLVFMAAYSEGIPTEFAAKVVYDRLKDEQV